MAVYDCCPFLNENDLYEIRLNQHWDYVDKFIVLEAGETHTGRPKSFNFDHKRFDKYKSKIIYRTFNSFIHEVRTNLDLLDAHNTRNRLAAGQNTDDWTRDHFQGNYFVKILREIQANDDDIVYISALDEILNHSALEQGLAQFTDKGKIYPLHMAGQTETIRFEVGGKTVTEIRPSFGFVLDIYTYKFNLRCTTLENIAVGQMTEFGVLKQIFPTTMRSIGLSTHPNIKDAGWHFASMDNTNGSKVLTKMQSWAHSRDQNIDNNKATYSATNEEEALRCLFFDSKINVVPINPDSHPLYLVDNLEKYDEYIDDGWFDNYKKNHPGFFRNNE